MGQDLIINMSVLLMLRFVLKLFFMHFYSCLVKMNALLFFAENSREGPAENILIIIDLVCMKARNLFHIFQVASVDKHMSDESTAPTHAESNAYQQLRHFIIRIQTATQLNNEPCSD